MDEFDYIVVGAGAAGCVLAARLSEDPAVRVLLLEAGPPDRKLEVRLPAAFPKLFRSPLDWAFETAPERGLDGRRVFFPRGRTLGGSTALNAMIYTRGDLPDLDFARVEETLSIEPLRDPNPLSRAFVAAAPGAELVRVTQRRGRRWSAADAYLRPVRRRPNLTIRTNAQVLGLAWAGEGRIAGVRLAGGEVRARREVVLCAGAIGTPHLLMLSGIGPAEHLAAHGVAVRHALPGVGQELVDHVLCPVVFTCRAPVSLKAAERPGQLLRYLLARRGMLTSNVGEALALLGDLEVIFAPVTWLGQGLEPPVAHGFTIGLVALAPASRGQIALASADPEEAPVIHAGYLTEPEDVRVLADGLRLVREIAAHPALEAFGDVTEQAPTAGAHTDAEVDAALRAVAQTIYHPAGTCQVVDDEFRVPGLDGLRIADASVLPRLPRAHPQAAVYALAERAAERAVRSGHGGLARTVAR